MTKLKSKNYKDYVESRLRRLSPFLQKYAMGDFSKQIPTPKEENEFTELLVGLNLMVDDIKELIKDKEKTIAELNKLKDTLLEEKEFSDTVLNAQQDTFFLFELATSKAIRWNQAFRDITGYTDKEIADLKAPDSYYSPEDLERTTVFIQEVLKQGEGKIDLELICKNGRKIPTEYMVSVIKNKKGEPKYFISIGRNISERKKAEKDLRESEEKYRSFVENFKGIAFRSHINWTPVYFHGAVEEITGYKEEDFISGNPKWNQVILEEDLKLLIENFPPEKFSDPEFFAEREYRIRCKDGKIRWVHDSLQSINDDSGNPIFLQGSLYDITERKHAEEEVKNTMIALEKSNQELERALNQVKTLSGLIPICSVCKKIRDDEGYWNFLELYLKEHSNAEFTHGLCPECERKLYTQKKK